MYAVHTVCARARRATYDKRLTQNKNTVNFLLTTCVEVIDIISIKLYVSVANIKPLIL